MKNSSPVVCSKCNAKYRFTHKCKQQHTPTPFSVSVKEDGRALIVSGGPQFTGEVIAVCAKEANAAFIVRAVNSHKNIIDTLIQTRIDVAWLLKWRETTESKVIDAALKERLVKLDLAIAKSEGL